MDYDPKPPRDLYMIAIGGTGMAPLACLLQQLGYRVRGSDGPLYPPMSTLLEAAGIQPLVGFDPAHLEPPPDLVIVGNAVPRTNPEAEALEASDIERISMPQALARFFLADRRPLVIAGTHGKTTTTSLAAWVYTDCGRDPGFLVGGIPKNLTQSFALGTGERFILEGDEYNAAYFDRGPKFFHYGAETLILTSVEYDHADLYPSAEKLDAVYRELVERVPADGLVLACGDHAEVRAATRGARARTLFYGLDPANDVAPEPGWSVGPAGSVLSVALGSGQPTRFELPAPGRHNLTNALAVIAAAHNDGIPAEDIARALGRFAGVKRRQEVVAEPGGVTVIDDFAHHPTAVAATLDALAAAYPGRRLCVALEPRSLTAARAEFFDDYLDALGRADRVFLAPVFHADRLEPSDRLDTERLAERLTARGTETGAYETIAALGADAVGSLDPGDVFVTMSSGSFDGLAQRVAEALAEAGAGTLGS